MSVILRNVWLDVKDNPNGAYKVLIDVDNSIISLTPNETKLKFVGVNNIQVGDAFLFEGKKFKMVGVDDTSLRILGKSEDGTFHSFLPNVIFKVD